jgi:hypothetical protein
MGAARAVDTGDLWQLSKEQDLAKLCELTGPHDVSVPHPLTTQQEITNICLKHESDD